VITLSSCYGALILGQAQRVHMGAPRPQPLPPARRPRGWQPASWTAPAIALGARLRAARRAAGLTIAQVAQAADAAVASVVAWEQGQHRPQRRSLGRLARLLGIPYDELLTLGDYPPKRPASPGRRERVDPQPPAAHFFGGRIAAAREAHGWTIDDLAGRTGKSRTTVRRWEAGLQRPPRHLVRRLATLLHIASEELMELAGYDATTLGPPDADTEATET
jgi:transcriptional regulator with XRE-family HTH domain